MKFYFPILKKFAKLFLIAKIENLIKLQNCLLCTSVNGVALFAQLRLGSLHFSDDI